MCELVEKKTLVSIIIPVYNAEQYIRETILAAKNQTYENIEILLIDDGSTDTSLSILKSFERNNIYVFTQANKGASAARNIGLKHAKGDYIQFLDADDVLDAEKIAIQVQVLEQEPNNTLCFGNWDKFSKNIEECNFPPNPIYKNYDNPLEMLYNFWSGKGMIALHAWLTPKELVEKAGFWNEYISLNDDGEFFCRVILKANKVIFTSNAKSYYRRGIPNSLSNSSDKKAVISLLLSYEAYVTNTLCNDNSFRTRLLLSYNFANWYYLFGFKYPALKARLLANLDNIGIKKMPIVGGKYFKLVAHIIGFEKAIRLKRYFNNY